MRPSWCRLDDGCLLHIEDQPQKHRSIVVVREQALLHQMDEMFETDVSCSRLERAHENDSVVRGDTTHISVQQCTRQVFEKTFCVGVHRCALENILMPADHCERRSLYFVQDTFSSVVMFTLVGVKLTHSLHHAPLFVKRNKRYARKMVYLLECTTVIKKDLHSSNC